MCLKLIKKIDSLKRLPINHTVYHYFISKNVCGKDIKKEKNKKEQKKGTYFLYK